MRRIYRLITCNSFWFDIGVMVPMLIFWGFLGLIAVQGLIQNLNENIINEDILISSLWFICLFLASCFLFFKSLIQLISWPLIGWIRKTSGRKPGVFIFSFSNRGKKYINTISLEVDKIRNISYMNTEFDVNTRNGEKIPVYSSNKKVLDNHEVSFKIPYKTYRESLLKNRYIWLKVNLIGFISFYRCFKMN